MNPQTLVLIVMVLGFLTYLGRATMAGDGEAKGGGMATLETLLREGAERSKAMEGRVAALDNRLKDMEQAAAERHATLVRKPSGLSVARMLYAARSGDWSEAKVERDACDEAGRKWREKARTLNISVDSQGALTVPEALDAELIEMLRNASIIESLPGIRRLDNMTVSPFKMNRQTGGTTHSWVAESGTATPSTPALGQIKAEPHKSMLVCKLTNEQIMLGAAGEEFVRQDMVQQMALGEQAGFLHGTGSVNQPTGLALMSGINALTPNGAIDLDDLADAITELALDDAPMRNLAWLLNPRTVAALYKAKDGEGRYLLDRQGAREFHGIPWFQTNAIPRNLTGGSGGSTDTRVYLVDASEIILFTWGPMQFLVSQHASASDGSSAFMQDETWLRVVRHRDIQVRHLESVLVATGVSN